MGRQGGFGFFLQEGGKGTVKLQKEPKQITFFFWEFWKFLQNMCNFAFLGTFFIDFCLQ